MSVSGKYLNIQYTVYSIYSIYSYTFIEDECQC